MLGNIGDTRRGQRERRIGTMAPVKVLDVAAYILQSGPMTATKLQKLCYYSQAWHLVWDEEPLFEERIEAWANGPVAPELYASHRYQYMVHDVTGGDPAALGESQRETVRVVQEFYGHRTGAELSELTHRERPWLDAREGYAPGAWCRQEITHASMAEYYESLLGTSADS